MGKKSDTSSFVCARGNENKSALFRSQRVADAAKIKIDDEAIKIRGRAKTLNMYDNLRFNLVHVSQTMRVKLTGWTAHKRSGNIKTSCAVGWVDFNRN
jgi:hypothetical protein